MRRSNPILLLLLLSLVMSGCMATPAVRYTPPEWTGDLPEECPEAHADLREVPILYGLVMLTEELQRQVDAGEVILGGCIVGSDKTALVCQVCRYTWQRGWWSKRRDNPREFDPPIDPLVAGIPIPVDGEPNYFRLITSDRTEEGLTLRFTTDPRVRSDRNLLDYLAEREARRMIQVEPSREPVGRLEDSTEGSMYLRGRHGHWMLHAAVQAAPAITYVYVVLRDEEITDVEEMPAADGVALRPDQTAPDAP